MGHSPVMLAVSGVKNSGKTTLIERLLPVFAARGVRVAVIKHDGHNFVPDVPGTDSARFFAAGACGTAVFDGEKAMVVRRGACDERDLIGQFPDADLVLLEGFKASPYPKIEVVRKGISGHCVCDENTLVAVVSDMPIRAAVPVFAPDAIEEIAQRIIGWMKESATAQL